MNTSSSANKISLKLFINKKTQTVVFAESGHDFVNFLFNLLNLPLGTLLRLLNASKMGCSLVNMYSSVENLSHIHFENDKIKELLLKPTVLPKYAIPPLLSEADISRAKFYFCGIGHHSIRITDDPDTKCEKCSIKEMASVFPYYGGALNTGELGAKYVKGGLSFMITDDFVVEPLSMISIMSLLPKVRVQELSSLEHRVVHVGKEEGLKLLMESMKSTKVLTNVFMQKTEQLDRAACWS